MFLPYDYRSMGKKTGLDLSRSLAAKFPGLTNGELYDACMDVLNWDTDAPTGAQDHAAYVRGYKSGVKEAIQERDLEK